MISCKSRLPPPTVTKNLPPLTPNRFSRLSANQNTLSMNSQPNSKRPTCPDCSKPLILCLCVRLKTRNFDNEIHVTILQHSLEKKHPLNSARIAKLGLKNVDVFHVTDVHFDAKFDILPLGLECTPGVCGNSCESYGSNSRNDEPLMSVTIAKSGKITHVSCQWKLLHENEHIFDCAEARKCLSNGFIVKKLQKKVKDVSVELELFEEFEIKVPPGSVVLFPSETSVAIDAIDFKVKNLIVLDGTWSKAKRMYIENPWLKILPSVRLDVEKMSLYSEVRKQPKVGYLSTIESIVYALKALGKAENLSELDNLLDVLESMVLDQRRYKDESLLKLSQHEVSNT